MFSSRGSIVAFASAALHTLAAMLMVLVIRHGLPPNSVESRLAFMNAHRPAWTSSWVIWSVTAISLIAVFVALRQKSALWVAVAGLVFDLYSESQYMLALPDLNGASFLALDRRLEILIGGVANSLYSIALAMLLLRMRFPRWINAAGWTTVVAGIVLAVASFAHLPVVSIVASAILFPCFVLWLIGLGLWLRRAV